MIRFSKSVHPLGFRSFAMRCICALKLSRGVLLSFALLAAPLAGGMSAVFAADATDAKANSASLVAADSISQSLRHLLDGNAPMGVTDLRAMQGHVRKLSD